MSQRSARLICLFLLVAFPRAAAVFAQPAGPQAWWPTQPVPLPFLHSLFTDDMVLQRDVEAPVWGWSTPGDTISIALDDQPTGQKAVAGDNGKWMTKIGPFKAGGPHTLTITGDKQRVVLSNVLCGDVWLCSGQSNMNWPLRLSQDAEEEVKQARHANIRSFTVGFYPSLLPMQLPQPARWEQCQPEFARNFTGVGYFFAREISSTQNVPVGIIHSSAGATTAEAWMSAAALQRLMPEDFPQQLAELKQLAGPEAEDYDYFAELEKWAAAVDPDSAQRKYVSDPQLDTGEWLDIDVPQPWETAGLGDFDGLVWFRRELDLPADWAGQDLLLQLSVINDVDITWFNGKLIGATQMKGAVRNYVVQGSLVKPGKNLLAAAVMNHAGPGGFCSQPQNMVVRPVNGPGNKNVRPAGKWKAKKAAAIKDIAVELPQPRVGNYKTISAMYNGMIAPLEPFAIKGAVWYQGESNWPRWLQYRRLLPALITHWREQFQAGDFPFLIVSLANYAAVQTKPVEPGWAEIRESQWLTARTVRNTGLANIIDTGDGDIHPRNKQEVGRRLALIARNLVYGEQDVVYSGPQFSEMRIEPSTKDRIHLSFKHLGGGLMIKPGDKKLTGFAIAGADKKFVWADAVIDGDTVIVSSPEVPEPKHARYGWASNPIGNLYNKTGLPAITFRTDE